jgi:membrane carboxypeptidase/penicillin-binding protein PbpC
MNGCMLICRQGGLNKINTSSIINFIKDHQQGESIFFKPEAGKYTITCLDDRGRDESIKIVVKYY